MRCSPSWLRSDHMPGRTHVPDSMYLLPAMPRTTTTQRTSGGRGSTKLRFLDETLAVVVLRVLGAFRRRRPLPVQPRRIGVMKSAGIGDMALATAIVRDIVDRFPEARVVIFAGADNAGIA